MTRQFPAAYDVAEYDNRLTSWYNMASQSPKRVTFLLDLSTNMGQGDKLPMAQAIVSTLLDTLIPEDLVNVIFIDDSTSVYRCFQEVTVEAKLVSADVDNIHALKKFVSRASVGGGRNQIFGAIGKAVEMLRHADETVPVEERMRGLNGTSCGGLRCAPYNEYLIVVSDGGFDVGELEKSQLKEVSKERPRMSLIGVAVGKDANPGPIRDMTCNMNGLFFHIKGLANEPGMNTNLTIHPSYILNEMSEYFQLVAAPLARNHSLFQTDQEKNSLSLDVTWALPKLSSDGSQIVVTLALPCFGDSASSTPRLLGVVAVDLLFLRPGDDIGNSIFSFFDSVEQPPIEADVEYAVVYKQGYLPRSLIDRNLIGLYGQFVGSLRSFGEITHYMFEDYMGQDFKASNVMSTILRKTSGSMTLDLNIRVPSDKANWKLSPMRYLRDNVTFAWRHVQGHPFVLIIRVTGKPDANDELQFMGIKNPLSRDEMCNFTGVGGRQGPCWSLPAHNIFEGVNASARGANRASLLYIPHPAYESTATYLNLDAAALPPYCGTDGHRPCDSQRLDNLMESINTGKRVGTEAGDGLLPRARDDVYLTSLVDFLWNGTFSSSGAQKYISRLYLSTVSGIFRTLGRPEYPHMIPPFLYQPNRNFWYLGAIAQNHSLVLFPPSLSFFETGKNGSLPPRVLTMSQALYYGYDHDINFVERYQIESERQAAAVMGAEVLYQPIHDALYGPDRLEGVAPNGNKFRCGDESSIGIIRCIVVNDVGVVISLPEFSADTASPERKQFDGTQPVFIGQAEPRLAEELIHLNVLVERRVRDVTVTSSNWGMLEGYQVIDSKLPIVADLHGLESDGVVFMSRIQGTNAYLIVIDMYVFEESGSTCDLFTYQCPSVEFPLVTSFVPDVCTEQVSPQVFKSSSMYALLPDYSQERVVLSLQSTDNCFVPLPDWVWQLVLAGAAFIGLILSAIGVRYLINRRKLITWLANRRVMDKMQDSRARKVQGSVNDIVETTFAVRPHEKIAEMFAATRKLAQEAGDIDDFRDLIQQQTDLIMLLAGDKTLAQNNDDARLDSLATYTGRLRTLVYNLQERLKAHEGIRVRGAGQKHTIKGEVQNIDKQFEDLQRKLEEMVLPSVSIKAEAEAPSQVDSPRSRERQNTLLLEERAFYTSHYPHLFKYEGDGSSTTRTAAKAAADEDMTDRSVASQSFVHSARARAVIAKQKEEALAKKPNTSAFVGAAITPRATEK